MSGADSTAVRKQAYFTKLLQLLEEYPKIIIAGADNVGSSHMQKIRLALRGKAVLLMGKNTMIRKAIRGQTASNPQLEAILPYVRGNVGFIFTKGDLSEVKKIVSEHRVAAPAKPGSIAPCKVVIPAGNTGLEPTQTSFLQALNIPSKITRGQIEIINDIPLIEEGAKVGASEANLLAKLDIKPFTYGLAVSTVYDNGSIYEPKVLDLTDSDILEKFQKGVKNVACVSLAVGYPTLASLPHSLARGFKNIVAISLSTEFPIAQAEKFKQALAAPRPVAVVEEKKEEKGKGGKEPAKPKVEVKEEEPDEDMGFGLFD